MGIIQKTSYDKSRCSISLDDAYFEHIYCETTSVDTEMCCPKGKCGCQYFILLTLKKKFLDTGSWIFLNKKTNPGLLFLLKIRSCVFISNFHHSPPPPPKGYKVVSLIIN